MTFSFLFFLGGLEKKKIGCLAIISHTKESKKLILSHLFLLGMYGTSFVGAIFLLFLGPLLVSLGLLTARDHREETARISFSVRLTLLHG